MTDMQHDEKQNGEDKENSVITEEKTKITEEFEDKGIESTEKIEEQNMEMGDLLDASFPELAPRQIVSGEVVKITDTDVVIDIGAKSEGIIPMSEFENDWENIEKWALSMKHQKVLEKWLEELRKETFVDVKE